MALTCQPCGEMLSLKLLGAQPFPYKGQPEPLGAQRWGGPLFWEWWAEHLQVLAVVEVDVLM